MAPLTGLLHLHLACSESGHMGRPPPPTHTAKLSELSPEPGI